MPCEKYSARMKDYLADAGLGTLPPDREAEAVAHFANCAACRDAFHQAQALYAAVDRGVGDLVSSEPSAQFQSRLRARLAAEPAPSRARQFWPAWAPVAAGALAVAAVVFFALRTHSPRPTNPSASPTIANRIRPGTAPEVAVISPSQLAPAEPSHRAHSNRAARPAEPEVLVEPGQLVAIEAYVEATRSGRVNGKEILAEQQQMESPLEIKPLEFAPLEKLDSDAPSGTSDDSGRP